MPRYFNTAGPCRPELHYMLPPEQRLPGVRSLIERQQYFVVHAPRQSGKTTTCRALAQSLTAEGAFTALLTTCETGQTLRPDVERSLAAVLDTLRQRAEEHLPVELRPPEADPRLPAETRLRDLLVRWSRRSPRPVVLFLDEIDALQDDALISVLRQLRSGYDDRPGAFPQSVALIGLRDVRDYRLEAWTERRLGTASPFNIKVESLTLPNFTPEEVAALLDQHTADTGQAFTPEARQLVSGLTGGHPWLVNALAREAVEEGEPAAPLAPVDAPRIEHAKEQLILRRDTHLDSLAERLREPRVRRVIEPILTGGLLPPGVLDDDLQYAEDLGLIVRDPNLAIANPIYREVVPRTLTQVMENSLTVNRPEYVGADGRIRFTRLLSDFRSFWMQNAEAYLAQAPYSEAAAQLVFMAFLQKVVNGGGFVDREYAIGSGRIDLCLRWPHPGGVERWALELKVWRDGRPDPLEQGLEQLSRYLDRLELATGTLILFDGRTTAPALLERAVQQEVAHRGRTLQLLRL